MCAVPLSGEARRSKAKPTPTILKRRLPHHRNRVLNVDTALQSDFTDYGYGKGSVKDKINT